VRAHGQQRDHQGSSTLVRVRGPTHLVTSAELDDIGDQRQEFVFVVAHSPGEQPVPVSVEDNAVMMALTGVNSCRVPKLGLGR